MLALLRPGWQGTKLEGDRFIFLVDNSASMSATDAEGAKNRLEEAKKLVGGLIDQMDSGMTAMIVSFADTPQVVQEFTDNRRLLRERLATIKPTVRGTDLHGALDLADGLANPGRITTEEGGAEIDVVEAAAGDALHIQRRPLRGRERLCARKSGRTQRAARLRADRLAGGPEPCYHRLRNAAQRCQAGRAAGLCSGRESLQTRLSRPSLSCS